MKVQKKKGEEGFSGILLRATNRYDLIILFVLLYLAYNTIDGVWLMSSDTIPATLLPVALIQNHSVYLDFATSYITSPGSTYAFSFVQGHHVSLFPIVTPVLVTPLYGLSMILSSFISPAIYGDHLQFFMAKSAASFISALAGVFIYLSAKELFSKKIAILTTFIFAFATTTWSISSQALWQHGTVELLLAAMIYLIIKNEQKESVAYVFLIGMLSGLFVFNRPPDSLLLIPVIFYLVWKERVRIPIYFSGAALTGLPFFWYNYTLFGNVFGGYVENIPKFTADPNFAVHFVALLIAPNVGLFVFCPVLLLSLPGLYLISTCRETRLREFWLICAVAVLFEILLYSFYTSWSSSAGFCYGPRFLTGLIPILCLFAGFFLEDWFGRGSQTHQGNLWWIAIIIVTGMIIVSAAIQIIGVFFYMYSPESNHTMSNERTWNAGDSIILRSYTEGLSKAPGISVFILPPLPPLIRYDF